MAACLTVPSSTSGRCAVHAFPSPSAPPSLPCYHLPDICAMIPSRCFVEPSPPAETRYYFTAGCPAGNLGISAKGRERLPFSEWSDLCTACRQGIRDISRLRHARSIRGLESRRANLKVTFSCYSATHTEFRNVRGMSLAPEATCISD